MRRFAAFMSAAFATGLDKQHFDKAARSGALLGTTPASCAKHDSALRPRLLDLSDIVSVQPTRHIIECEQMRAR